MSKTIRANLVSGATNLAAGGEVNGKTAYTTVILEEKSMTLKSGLFTKVQIPYSSISNIEHKNLLTSLSGEATIHTYDWKSYLLMGFSRSNIKFIKEVVSAGHYSDSDSSACIDNEEDNIMDEQPAKNESTKQLEEEIRQLKEVIQKQTASGSENLSETKNEEKAEPKPKQPRKTMAEKYAEFEEVMDEDYDKMKPYSDAFVQVYNRNKNKYSLKKVNGGRVLPWGEEIKKLNDNCGKMECVRGGYYFYNIVSNITAHVSEAYYEKVNAFGDKLVVVKNNKGHYSLCDSEGVQIMDWLSDIDSLNKNGQALVKNQLKQYAVIDAEGKLLCQWGDKSVAKSIIKGK